MTRPAPWVAAGSAPRSSWRSSGTPTASTESLPQQFLIFLENTVHRAPGHLAALPGAGGRPDLGAAVADAAAGRHLHGPGDADRRLHRDARRLEPRRAASTGFSTGITLTLYSMPEWWLGLLLIAAFAVGIGPFPGFFPTGGLHSTDVDPASLEGVLDTALAPDPAGDHADPGLPGRLLAGHAVARCSTSSARTTWSRRAPRACATSQVRRRHAVRNALLPTHHCPRSTSASWCPARSRSRPSSRSPASDCSPPRRSRSRTSGCCRARS